MNTILDLLHNGASYIVPMVVLLGLLIFVHELGHFLVAKYYKVRVEVFSLGFGPKILKFKRGDTTYAVSAIPLGGYVKMFGEDPTAQIAPEERAVSFTHKPVGQRIAVVLAGPIMNFFFAIVVFGLAAVSGEQALKPVLGDINLKSAAAQAGFQSGDIITKIGTQAPTTWDDLQTIIEDHGGQALAFEVKRANGEIASISSSPVTTDNKNLMSWSTRVGEIEGLTPTSRLAVVGVADPQSAAYRIGVRTGDVIATVNGKKVEYWRDAVAEIGAAAKTGELKLGLLRGAGWTYDQESTKAPEEVVMPLTAEAGDTPEKVLERTGIEYPELFLGAFEREDAPAALAGLKKGDRIVTINTKAIHSFDDVVGQVQTFSPEANKSLQMFVMREGKLVSVDVTPKLRERQNINGREERKFEIGIHPMILAAPATFTVSADGPVAAVTRGIKQSVRWTSLTVLSFVRLFQAQVSSKNIGGFFSIGAMAKKSWQMGLAAFLNVMGIISINLFVLNLLPVPVLDGGHFLFYSIEAIRGAPLGIRKLEIAQQVGLFLLLSLMVYAMFNDVSRVLGH